MTDLNRTVEAVWRIEGAQVTATLARMTGDIGLAEELAQDAFIAALEQWPESGVPANPGAWLTTVAKRRAIDQWRRQQGLGERYRLIAEDLARAPAGEWEPIEDDLLRLLFTTCHPTLSREAQVSLTLKTVGGLSNEEIARLLLVGLPTVQQRIVRAKKSLRRSGVRFEAPDPTEWGERVAGVLSVIYLVFTEGYSATAGETAIRRDLADEAIRLGRILAGLMPREPEVQALVALMEYQASRFPARTRDGKPVLLEDQDRGRWDRAQIARADRALAQADALSTRRGNYALQAAIAQCHAHAVDVESTDWSRIVSLYEELERLGRNPVVALNRAVAVAMASGPAPALELVDEIAGRGELRGSHLIPSVRGELLSRLGRHEEAREEFLTATELMTNEAQRSVLLAKAARAGADSKTS